MTTKDIALLKSKIKNDEAVVILPLKKWQKMQKREMELKMAIEAIIAGEMELREGKTKPFKEFIKEICQK